MKLFAIETGNFKLDGGAMFGVVPKVIWNKLYPADENNLCNWTMRCLLIDSGEHKILIDTGIGTKQDAKFFGHYYLNGDDSLEKSLNKYGYSFSDITDIIHTHLHFDHCGGTITYDKNRNLIPQFPNANIWVSREQWNLAINPNQREKASFLKENILPMEQSGKLKLIDSECELFPNVFIKLYSGHTKGQIIPHIKFNNKWVFFCGDLFPSSAHVPMPYIMSYDMRPEETLRDKERFFKDASIGNFLLFFEHDIFTETATLINTDKGMKINEKLKLADFLLQ